jgi:integrase/recombinase XerC
MTNEEYIKKYVAHLSFEKRLSQITIKHYLRDINKLLELNKNKAITDLKTENIRHNISALHSQGLNGRSLSRMISAWKGLCNFLIEYYDLKKNPVLGIRAPRSSKKLPQILSVDQTIKLVNINDKSFIGIRDQAILELFYSSGLRLTELTNINLTDISFEEGTITVTGKGNKTRIIPVGKIAIKAIKEWLSERLKIKSLEPDNNALFISKQSKRLTQRAIQYRLKYWAIKQGVQENIHPHLLRHSFASHILQSSQDLRAVQELLGHQNITTTQIYTHLDFQHLAKIYDKSHPRAKKK